MLEHAGFFFADHLSLVYDGSLGFVAKCSEPAMWALYKWLSFKIITQFSQVRGTSSSFKMGSFSFVKGEGIVVVNERALTVVMNAWKSDDRPEGRRWAGILEQHGNVQLTPT